jgi:hypothetical protein
MTFPSSFYPFFRKTRIPKPRPYTKKRTNAIVSKYVTEFPKEYDNLNVLIQKNVNNFKIPKILTKKITNAIKKRNTRTNSANRPHSSGANRSIEDLNPILILGAVPTDLEKRGLDLHNKVYFADKHPPGYYNDLPFKPANHPRFILTNISKDPSPDLRSYVKYFKTIIFDIGVWQHLFEHGGEPQIGVFKTLLQEGGKLYLIQSPIYSIIRYTTELNKEAMDKRDKQAKFFFEKGGLTFEKDVSAPSIHDVLKLDTNMRDSTFIVGTKN